MAMKWEKCSTELSDILFSAMAAVPAQKRIMFGCPAYFVNGNMFAGVHQSNIILRLTAADRQLMMKEFDEAAPFEPFPGRPMKEYLTVPAEVYENASLFSRWIGKSLANAVALPSKTTKSKEVRKEK